MLASNNEDNKPHGSTYLTETALCSAKFAKRTYVALRQRYRIEYKNLRVYGNLKNLTRFDEV